MNRVYWHTTKAKHFCEVHGDTCAYGVDAEDRKVCRCKVCGAKVVVIYDNPTTTDTTKEKTE